MLTSSGMSLSWSQNRDTQELKTSPCKNLEEDKHRLNKKRKKEKSPGLTEQIDEGLPLEKSLMIMIMKAMV